MSTTLTESLVGPNTYDLQTITSRTSTSKARTNIHSGQINTPISLSRAVRSQDDITHPSTDLSPSASSHNSPQDLSSVVEIPINNFLPARRANIIIVQLSLTTFLISLSTGLIVVGIPHIAVDLALPAHLYLWPSSVFGLTAGSTLLLAGAIADVVGARLVELAACVLLGSFTLACGFSQTGIQLVAFRALQGVATAMHMPCATSLIAGYVPSGKRRNIGFACLGLSMCLGFLAGLVLGGILIDTIGWRSGFYITGGVMLLQFLIGLRVIPAQATPHNVLQKLREQVDWIGATIACAGLAMFSYVLAIVGTNSSNIKRPESIAILTLSLILIISFPFWMQYQTKKNRPVLIPNALWKNIPFSCVCVLTVFTWGCANSMEVFSSL